MSKETVAVNKEALYQRSYFNRLGELGDLVPDTYKAFTQFNKAALSEGKLSRKLKELIAIAVAHTTGCPYCIEVHVQAGKTENVTKEELSEAVLVATALKAGSAIAHGVNALNAYDEVKDEELYKASYFRRLKEFSELNGDIFKTFLDFDEEALKDNILSVKEKELIAVAVAHTTGCPYCVVIHTKGAKKAGVTKEELAESIFVATLLKAGSAIAYSVNALNAYDA